MCGIHSHNDNSEHSEDRSSRVSPWLWIVGIAAAGALIWYLWQGTDVPLARGGGSGWLLFLIAMPLMHLFMHGGHSAHGGGCGGGHAGHGGHTGQGDRRVAPDPERRSDAASDDAPKR